MIEHLQSLGVTAVELMPVHQFVHDHPLADRGLRKRRSTPSVRSSRVPPAPAWSSRIPDNSCHTPHRLQTFRGVPGIPLLIQFIEQQPARPMQPGAHRADGAAQRRGGYGIVQFLQIA